MTSGERPSESLEERVRRAVRERIDIVPYDPRWPDLFREERARLLALPSADLFGRIEHFGSTAVPGLDAKPVVDMLVEASDLAAVRERTAPELEARGYDYFWRCPFPILVRHGKQGLTTLCR